jgi:outer membrane protein OmpA-like peptidoglycan-associated protein
MSVDQHGGTRASLPRRRVVVTEASAPELLPDIAFEGLSATISVTSLRTLDLIASTLAANPSIELVEVIAYGSDGDARFQQVIGAARAQKIVDELIQRGVPSRRLRAAGMARPAAGHSSRPELWIVRRRP